MIVKILLLFLENERSPYHIFFPLCFKKSVHLPLSRLTQNRNWFLFSILKKFLKLVINFTSITPDYFNKSETFRCTFVSLKSSITSVAEILPSNKFSPGSVIAFVSRSKSSFASKWFVYLVWKLTCKRTSFTSSCRFAKSSNASSSFLFLEDYLTLVSIQIKKGLFLVSNQKFFCFSLNYNFNLHFLRTDIVKTNIIFIFQNLSTEILKSS